MSRGRLLVVVLAAAALLGAIVFRASFSAGYSLDDYLQVAMVEGGYPVERGPFDLYRFAAEDGSEQRALRNFGTLPWFSDPALRLVALRPLSSGLLWLEHSVFASPAASHASTALFSFALLAAVGWLFWRHLPLPAAVLALGAFALDPAHAVPLAWVANRAAYLSALFGVLALGAYSRYRTSGRKRDLAGSLALYTLALAAGEYGVAMLAYFVGYEAMYSSGEWKKRVRAIAPVALLAAGYVAIYPSSGYGAFGSAGYVDPLSSPGAFLFHATPRALALLGEEFLQIDSIGAEQAIFASVPVRVAAVGGLLFFFALALGIFKRLEAGEKRAILFFSIGGLLSLGPMLAPPPETRLLLLPSIGGSAVVGMLVWGGTRPVASSRRDARPVSWVVAALAGTLALLHLAIGPWRARQKSVDWAFRQQLALTLLMRAPLEDDESVRQDVYVLNALDPYSVVFGPFVRFAEGKPLPRSWRTLTVTGEPLRLTRPEPNTIELSASRGMLENTGAGFFRSQGFSVGDRVELDRLSVEVLEMGAWGPKMLRFVFPQSLESDRLLFLEIAPTGLTRATIPPVGAERLVPSVRIAYDALDAAR